MGWQDVLKQRKRPLLGRPPCVCLPFPCSPLMRLIINWEMVKWVKSEDWPDSKPIILRAVVPIIAFEDPTSFVIVLRSRPIPIDVIQCRTADTCSDIGIHIAVVSLAVFVTSRRAEVRADGRVVALLRHAPVRHLNINKNTQPKITRQAGAAGIRPPSSH